VNAAEKGKSQAVSMTKADLITIIADKLRFPWARAELLVDVVLDCMEQSMSRGEKIEIRGFGTFQVRSYRAYRGRNPRTGQVVAVRPKRLPHFKVSIELAARINQGRGTKPKADLVTACHGPTHGGPQTPSRPTAARRI
jgi:Bacterial nucleoid DNA-binding protein